MYLWYVSYEYGRCGALHMVLLYPYDTEVRSLPVILGWATDLKYERE